jgi:hypothetical protein
MGFSRDFVGSSGVHAPSIGALSQLSYRTG